MQADNKLRNLVDISEPQCIQGKCNFSHFLNSTHFLSESGTSGEPSGGLLRLHSTYRHDLKIYSSDEGRVQTSAAAFAKGLLDLEGTSLTPILVSLVQKVGKINIP